ncbi:hypothetical protein SRHO_G00115250 [Serrasalmus rhombeus]
METQSEESRELSQEKRGCLDCCIKCLGGVPYASLVATILCFSGVALFCGCGHVALTGTLTILETHFSKITADHAMLTDIIQLMQYVIYGIASFFFLYGIILLAEGFYTTSAVKELHSEFKTTICGRCISAMFVFLTYILGVAWLGVFGFSAVPVFLFYNMWSTCAAMRAPVTSLPSSLPSNDSICVDMRQYGRSCSSLCHRDDADGSPRSASLLQIHYLMILSANWAYLKDASHMHAYQDIKSKEERELQDIPVALQRMPQFLLVRTQGVRPGERQRRRNENLPAALTNPAPNTLTL